MISLEKIAPDSTKEKNNETELIKKDSKESVQSDLSLHNAPHNRCENRVALKVFTEPLNNISVNPFVNYWMWTNWEAIRSFTLGAVMVVIRLVPILFVVLLLMIWTKLFLLVIAVLNHYGVNSESTRRIARKVSFVFIRIFLFIAGFYWIRTIDKRKNSQKLSTIIPIAPHSSFYDMIFMLTLNHPSFVSRSENLKAPIIGNLLRLCNGIYVDRSDKNSRMATINAICERANKNEQIMIFPEGTCTNRSTLIQFKLGAFIPKLPVQPVIVRWDAGEQDSVSWSWEGPSSLSVFLHTLTRISTNCEITIMSQYEPSKEESLHPRLFAENVSKLMCTDLGVLQSFYSYDDVPFMPVAKSMRMFRSPACILILKLCTKMQQLKKISEESSFKEYKTVTDKRPASISTQQRKDEINPFKLNGVDCNVLGVGEDMEHVSNTVESYTPKHFSKQRQKFKSQLCLYISKLRDEHSESQKGKKVGYLPISDTTRPKFDRWKTPPPKEMNEEKWPVYYTFCEFIEHCINILENKFVDKEISSSLEVIKLLELENFVNDEETWDVLKHTSIFTDLIKIVEFTVYQPINTIHLLIVMHLCDLREPDMWERIRVATRLFHMLGHNYENNNRTNTRVPKLYNPVIRLSQFRTLLWYTLGVQEFNDQFFTQAEFDYEYIVTNLVRLFNRAVSENACQLLD